MKRHLNKILIAAIVVLSVILIWLGMQGCTQTLNITPISEMTPKQKSLVAIKTYNNLVDNYKAKLALPNLSAAEKRVLNAEYQTIQKVWSVIKAYDDYVQGLTPNVETTIIEQLNQFLNTYRY